MGRCEKCAIKIDDKYKYCQDCNNKFAKDNSFLEIAQALKYINQNLGLRNEFLKRQNPKMWEEIQADWKKKEEQ